MNGNNLLIVGLGNPGSAYESTRHNIGELIIKAVAKDQGWKFKKDPHLKAEIAFGMKDQKEVHLLFPTTFMNNSGLAVQRALEMFQIDIQSLLIVVDDVYIPLGEFRLREKGAPGGHNGVKSVTNHLLTPDFHRLKVGVGAPYIGDLEEFVLGQFTKEEFVEIPKVVSRAQLIIDSWIKGDVGRAKELASTTTIK